MPHTTISKFDNIIDSRDIIARIEELEGMTDACGECGGTGTLWSKTNEDGSEAKCPACVWGDVSGRDEDDDAELAMLKDLTEEAEGYSPDWRYGATLIRDSYFRDYAEQLADDIGAIDSDAKWPLTYIDWDAAADALKQDYTSVDFDGETYWVR